MDQVFIKLNVDHKDFYCITVMPPNVVIFSNKKIMFLDWAGNLSCISIIAVAW